MQNLSLLSGDMTQPFVASAPAKLCDLASPASNGSGNNVAAHITNTLEFAEAPVLKFGRFQNMKPGSHYLSLCVRLQDCELGHDNSDM